MTLLARTPYTPPAFAQMEAWKALMLGTTEDSYAKMVEGLAAVTDVAVSAITYESDGLKITGVEVLPAPLPPEKMPLLIYNRGGSGNFGMLNASQIRWMMAEPARQWKMGVLASNYRGNGGSEGREEWGGAELNDILALIEIGKAQPWWDGKNIFMLGWSRGGMMTYLSIKHGLPITAAAVGAGAADIAYGNQLRPEMEKVCERFIPNYEENREQALSERSAVCWPEAIDVPTLILHGDTDMRVNVEEARQLYAKLSALGKPAKYVEYAGGDHGLWNHYYAYMDEIARWFTEHQKR